MTLVFEGPVATKLLPVFSFRVHFPTQEYRFFGAAAEPAKSMPPGCSGVIERIRGLTQAYLGTGDDGPFVSIVLRGDRMPDLLPLVDETRRTLDGGSEVAIVPNQQARKNLATSRSAATPRVVKAPPTPIAVPTPVEKTESPMEPTPPVDTAPAERPYVMLASPKPGEASAFHSRVFQQKPVRKTRDSHYVEMNLGSLLVAFQDDLSKEERKLYGYGPVERNRGWGAIFLVRVTDFDACLRRAKRIPGAVLREMTEPKSFVLRDPAGYLFEVAPR